MKQVFLLILLFLAFSPKNLYAQYLGYSFKADPTRGEKLYNAACASCHGDKGQGTPRTIAAFQQPRTFPDFTRCDQTTPEVDVEYKAVIKYGGPNRGFSQIMPAFRRSPKHK